MSADQEKRLQEWKQAFEQAEQQQKQPITAEALLKRGFEAKQLYHISGVDEYYLPFKQHPGGEPDSRGLLVQLWELRTDGKITGTRIAVRICRDQWNGVSVLLLREVHTMGQIEELITIMTGI